MIEINLIEKRAFKLPVIAGVDLAKINYLFILIAAIVGFAGEQFLGNFLQKQLTVINQEMAVKTEESEKLRVQMEEFKYAKDLITEFNRQITEVQNRMDRVSRIMRTRTNPNVVLEQIALSTASDVWLTHIIIDKDRKISVNGNSKSYKGMGTFLNSLNKYSSFSNGLRIENSSTKELAQPDGAKVRIEEFRIAGVIKNYESF